MWAFSLTVPATAAGQVLIAAALEASRGDGRGAWEVPLMISLSEHFSCLLHSFNILFQRTSLLE